MIFGYLEWSFQSTSKIKLWVQNWVSTHLNDSLSRESARSSAMGSCLDGWTSSSPATRRTDNEFFTCRFSITWHFLTYKATNEY